MMKRVTTPIPRPTLVGRGASTRAVPGGILRSWQTLVVLSFAFVGAMLWNYEAVISPTYDYQGFTFAWPGLLRMLFTMLLGVTPLPLLRDIGRRPSYTLAVFLYAAVYIPSLYVPLVILQATPEAATQLQLIMAVSYLAFLLPYRVAIRPLKRYPMSEPEFWAGVIVLLLLGCLAMTARIGFSFRMPTFNDVYDVRASFQDSIGGWGRLFIYLFGWLANVFVPIVFIAGWIYRRWTFLALAIVAQVWLYGIGGYKHILFALPCVTAVLILSRARQRRYMLQWSLAGLTAIAVISGIFDLLSDTPMLSSLFVRRVLLTPGLLSFFYFDFFSENPLAFLGHSVLRWLVDYPYDLAPPFLIGHVYAGVDTASLNANLWADAYCNFGFAGMVLASVTLSAFCWLYDSIAASVDYRFASALLAVPSFALTNGALLTTLATHGLGLCLLVLLVLPRGGETKLAHQRSNDRLGS